MTGENEVRCLHLLILNKSGLQRNKKTSCHPVPERTGDESPRIQVNIRIKSSNSMETQMGLTGIC